jgi:hypothetical protein
MRHPRPRGCCRCSGSGVTSSLVFWRAILGTSRWFPHDVCATLFRFQLLSLTQGRPTRAVARRQKGHCLPGRLLWARFRGRDVSLLSWAPARWRLPCTTSRPSVHTSRENARRRSFHACSAVAAHDLAEVIAGLGQALRMAMASRRAAASTDSHLRLSLGAGKTSIKQYQSVKVARASNHTPGNACSNALRSMGRR